MLDESLGLAKRLKGAHQKHVDAYLKEVDNLHTLATDLGTTSRYLRSNASELGAVVSECVVNILLAQAHHLDLASAAIKDIKEQNKMACVTAFRPKLRLV